MTDSFLKFGLNHRLIWIFLFGTAILFFNGCASSPSEYDFIIVGGGAAGCLLASRLSQFPDWSVLLIEAGGEENILQDIPLFAALSQLTPANWGYTTEKSPNACLGLNDGRCYWPRGKVLGGSSVLNYMTYTRGNVKDYDRWAELGNTGWGYDDVLKYFLQHEDMLIPELAKDTKYHSTKGEVPITHPSYHTESAAVFIEAAKERGFKSIDYNGKEQIGYSFLQSTLKNGLRVSANTAFLKPIRNRKNLKVLTRSQVTKILMNNNTAYGVEYKLWNFLTFQALARKEIIISAGAINSPQLLMLSGIGPKDHLQSLGIPVLKDSKVGHNLQDHMTLGNLFFVTNDSITLRTDNILNDMFSIGQYLLTHTGVLTVTGGSEAIGFEDFDGDGLQDLEMLYAGTTTASLAPTWKAWGGKDDIYNVYKVLEKQNAFMIIPLLMHPKSRGELKLKDSNPLSKPLLYHNYFTESEDMDNILKGIKRALSLVDLGAFQKHGAKLFDKPLESCKEYEYLSDAYWKCNVEYMTFTMYHQCGTCKMGPDSDPDAVVDPNLRVRGVNKLRVIDASIIPLIPTGHLVAPTYMIAEKGAAMIIDFWRSSNKTGNV